MKYVLVFCLLAIGGIESVAQCISGWSNQVGGVPLGSQASVGYGLVMALDGSVYSMSSEFRSDSILIENEWIPGAGSTNTQNRDFLVVKYSSAGEPLWHFYGGGPDQDYAKGVALDTWGNLYLTGQFRDTLCFNGTNQVVSTGIQDIFLCKVSPTGSLVWALQYGNSTARGVSVTADSDGVYSASLFFSDSIVLPDTTYHCGQPSGQSDVVVMKHDHDGNYLWSRHITGVNSQQIGDMEVRNGHLIIAGVFIDEFVFGNYSLNGNSTSRYYLLDIDTQNGSLNWSLPSIGGGLSAIVESIGLDASNNIYLSGRFNTPTLSFSDLQVNNGGQYDYFILKVSDTGTPTWLVSSDGPGFEVIYGLVVINQQIVVTGGVSQNAFNVGSSIIPFTEETDLIVAMYDINDGSGICGYSISGGGVEQGLAIAASGDELLVQGIFNNLIELDGLSRTTVGSQDVFVWKTCLPCDTLTSIAETTGAQPTLQVHPNPSSTQTQLSYRSPQGTRPTLQLTDMLGRTVQSVQLPSHEGTYTLDAATLGTGVYFCSLLSGAEVLATEKLSVIRNE